MVAVFSTSLKIPERKVLSGFLLYIVKTAIKIKDGYFEKYPSFFMPLFCDNFFDNDRHFLEGSIDSDGFL